MGKMYTRDIKPLGEWVDILRGRNGYGNKDGDAEQK
jgi:hypothetical protein